MTAYIWPWPSDTEISQYFGTNPGGVNPAGGHTGTDGACPAGTPLRAPADGVVTFEGWANLSNNPYLLTDGGGICVVIDFGEGKPACVLGHLSASFVNVGQAVKQGDIVAESGNTGKWTTGPHCHFEILPPTYDLNSDTYGRVNPADWCTGYWEEPRAQVAPYQRESQTKVWQRNAPEHRDDSNRVKLWDERLVFDFRAWTRGTDPYGDGNTTWFVGAYTDTYFHSSAFFDMGVHDLPEITRAKPEPPPTPDPVVVVPDWPHLNGVDVSNNNHGVRLDQLPADFVWIKASEGIGWADPDLADNVAEARAQGAVVGFYHFPRPSASNLADAEAAWFLSVIKPYLQVGDLTALDWESYRDGAGVEHKEHLSDARWALEFVDYVESVCGSESFFYAGVEAINAIDWNEEHARMLETSFPLWHPRYGSNVGGGYAPVAAPADTTWAAGVKMLQYTSRGRLPGYEGDLDLNVFYGVKVQLMDYGAKVRVPEPPVDPGKPGFPTLDDPIRALVAYYAAAGSA